MGPLAWLFLAGLAGGGVALAVSSSSKTDLSKYIGRLKDSNWGGLEKDAPTGGFGGPQITTWNAGASAVMPSALEWVTREISAGRSVWNDPTILGSGTFFLQSTSGDSPGKEWSLLAASSDLPELNNAAGGGFRKDDGDKKPIEKPSDLPTSPKEVPENSGGWPLPPNVPPTTGITDVDTVLRSDDTTPAKMRSIATSFRKNGNIQLADSIDRYANHRYTQLRAAHTAKGGTPWLVREGDIPSRIAKHYGGTLAQIEDTNKGRPWSQWLANGRTVWLMPLSWDIEAKEILAPLPSPTKKPSRGEEIKQTPHVPLPDTTARSKQRPGDDLIAGGEEASIFE